MECVQERSFTLAQCIARRERQLDTLHDLLEQTIAGLLRVKQNANIYSLGSLSVMRSKHVQALADHLQRQCRKRVIEDFQTAWHLEGSSECLQRILELQEVEAVVRNRTNQQWGCIGRLVASCAPSSALLGNALDHWLLLMPSIDTTSYLSPLLQQLQCTEGTNTTKQEDEAMESAESPRLAGACAAFPAKCCFASAPSPLRASVFSQRFSWSWLPPSTSVSTATAHLPSAVPDTFSLPLRHLQHLPS